MNNQLTTFSSYDPQAWMQMQKMAEMFFQSKALPSTIDNLPKLMMVFQAARDSGLTATEALNAYYFVNGRLTMYGQIALSQVTKAGFKVEWGECNEKTATVKISREDRGEITETYTFDQAQKAKLTAKDVWQKFPGNMLRWKAFGNAQRFFCPEALNGFYIKEDLEGSIDEEKQDPKEDGGDEDFEAAKKQIAEANTEDALREAKKALMNKVWPPEEYNVLAKAWMEKRQSIAPKQMAIKIKVKDEATEKFEELKEAAEELVESPPSDEAK